MPKSTQIAEVGDWVIVCAKDSEYDYIKRNGLFGDLVQIKSQDYITPPIYIVRRKNGKKYFELFGNEFYIVKSGGKA